MKRVALQMGGFVVGALLAFVSAAAGLSWLFGRWGDEDVAACRQMWLAAKDTSGAGSCAGLRFDTFPMFGGMFVVMAVTVVVLAGIQLARFRSAGRERGKDQAITVRSVDVGDAGPGKSLARNGQDR
jgi:hypothetical protein